MRTSLQHVEDFSLYGGHPAIRSREHATLLPASLDVVVRFHCQSSFIWQQLSVLVAMVARVEWPRQWPQLFPSLVSSATSGVPLRERRALYTIGEVNKKSPVDDRTAPSFCRFGNWRVLSSTSAPFS